MSTSFAPPAPDLRPLIAHVVFSFDYGGLENGVVNLVNHLPDDRSRHAIIALTRATDFRKRLRRSDVQVYELHKSPGKDPGLYLRLYRLLRSLRPDIVHTRNLPTLEAAVVARLAGVRACIHSEHGWDIYDPEGRSRKYRALRRVVSPAVNRFVTVSQELERWLTGIVGVTGSKVECICNGVDMTRFDTSPPVGPAVLPAERFPPGAVVIGSVTRFSDIKDPLNLVRAFIAARTLEPTIDLRLLMAGDGALRAPAQQLLDSAGAAQFAWLPGSRDDVPRLLRSVDVYALGSRREGISNTVLEAMASGLPVVATATGGNLELVQDGVTGRLVAAADPAALSQVLVDYARNPAMRAAHGAAGRARVEREYSLERMISRYEALYQRYGKRVGEAA